MRDLLRRVSADLPWLALLTASLPFLVVVVRAAVAAGEPLTVSGDYAVLELGTRSALGLDQLLGPYSRYLWNHPGPAIYFAAAPLYGVTGTEAGGLGLGAACWNLAIVVAIVVIADVSGGRRWAWAAAFTIVGFSFAYGPEQFADPWNPVMTVLPIAGVAVAGAAFAAGRRWALPVLAVVATIAVQTHVGSVPVAASVVAVSVAAGVVVAARTAGVGWAGLARPALATAALSALLWAPPLWQQLTHEPGNLGELVAFARRDVNQEPHAWKESFEAATELVVGVHRPVGRVVRESGPSSPLPDLSVAEWVLAAVLQLGMLAALIAGIVRRRWFGAVLAGIGIVGWSASILAARAAQGGLYVYLLAFVSGVSLAAWLAVVGGLAASIPRRLAVRIAPMIPVAGLVCSGLVAVDAARGPLPLDRYASPGLAPLVAAAVDAVHADGARVVRLRIVHDSQWPTAAAVAVALEDAGVEVTVERPWTFMFGEERAPTGDEGALVSIDRPGRRPPAVEDRLVAAAQGSVVYVAPELHAGPAADPAPP